MYKIYEIEEGDTLNNIAKKFNTTPEILNKINSNIPYIEKGIQIVVPVNSNIPFILYKVKKGDSIYDIAKKNKINYLDILAINGLKDGEYIYPDQEILIPRENIGIYNVDNVMTLNQVADKLNQSPNELLSQNASIYLLPNQIIVYKKEKTI